MMARAKRTISPEYLKKMQEGKRKAAEHRAARAECDAMLDDLTERLRRGREGSGDKIRMPKARRKRRY